MYAKNWFSTKWKKEKEEEGPSLHYIENCYGNSSTSAIRREMGVQSIFVFERNEIFTEY